jgi:hypothetical protein
MIFFSIIGDARFFTDVPAFLFMKESAQEVHKKITDAIINKDRSCLGCSDVKTAIRPLFMVFAEHLQKLKKESPDALVPFVEYIISKRGYRPDPIALYLRQQGKLQVVEV